MTTTWTPAPAGFEGETGSHIPEQAASRYFTEYRTADGYSWHHAMPGYVGMPDGRQVYVQYDAAGLPAAEAARVREVIQSARRLQDEYPEAPVVAPETPEWRSHRGLTLSEEMDSADTMY